MRRVGRGLRGFFALLHALELLFLAVVLLSALVILALGGLRWVLLAILSGDRVVTGVTAAIFGFLLGWPVLREHLGSARSEGSGDEDP